jgi:hypothetical protein
MDQQRPVRRIVTGQNEHGHSRIVEDGVLSLTPAEFERLAQVAAGQYGVVHDSF